MSALRLLVVAVLLALLGGGLVGCGGGGADAAPAGPAAPAAAALPDAAAPAFAIPEPEPLAEGAEAIWAPLREAGAARAAPSYSAPVVAEVPALTPEGTRNLVVVRGRARGDDGSLWAEVELPSTGAPLTGWLPRGALGGYHVALATLHVDRDALRATLRSGDEELFSAPVGVGEDSYPTPAGRFYVRNHLADFESAAYGPVAFGTSARSEVLTDWPGGAFVGIHGTDQPDILPGRVSHGCIRMRNEDVLALAALMPVGTPVVIV